LWFFTKICWYIPIFLLNWGGKKTRHFTRRLRTCKYLTVIGFNNLDFFCELRTETHDGQKWPKYGEEINKNSIIFTYLRTALVILLNKFTTVKTV
jgi:hypothetical protein